MAKPVIVLIGGSLRTESLNRRLMGHVARELEVLGQAVRVFQGDDLRIPLLEEGADVPLSVAEMAHALRNAAGVVFVSPEYNAGIPGHLKNVVDWLSVQTPQPFTGLKALVASASPGALGGARAILAWRAVLANLGCWMGPGAITIPRADEILQPDGTPLEVRSRVEVRRTLEAFVAGPKGSPEEPEGV